MSRNVLLIMTDQHRADCLGGMGHPMIQTPHLDRLGSEGVVFENAICQTPACMASRASLLTGRYPEAVRVRGMGVLPPQETTLPEHLLRNGYATAAFGKVHLTPEQYTLHHLKSDMPILDWRRFAEPGAMAPAVDDPYKRDYGFEIHVGCDDACQGNFRAWLRREAPELANLKPTPLRADGPGDLWVSPFPSEYHQSTYIASQAEAFVRSQSPEKPWFALCSFVAPHHPFDAPADQIARYPLADVPPPELKGGVDAALIPEPARSAIGEMEKFSDEVRRQIVQHYLASISLIDDGVGRLVTALAETGQLDNTLIVFVADHGEFLGNHGLLRKPSLHYDETLHVPLLVRGPGVTPGRRVSGLVELVDIYPTVLGLLGIEANAGVQGCDWSAALAGGGDIGREDAYSDMFDMDPMVFARLSGPYMACVTLRSSEWKLNVYPTAGSQFGQLFDLRNDPQESRNLYADVKYAAVRSEMTWRLLSRMHRQTDPLPLRLTQW